MIWYFSPGSETLRTSYGARAVSGHALVDSANQRRTSLKAAESQLTGDPGCAGETTESPLTVSGTFSPAKNCEKTSPRASTPAWSSR